MGKLGEAIERAFEKLKDPTYRPPEPETFELSAEPQPGEYHVMFLRQLRSAGSKQPRADD